MNKFLSFIFFACLVGVTAGPIVYYGEKAKAENQQSEEARLRDDVKLRSLQVRVTPLDVVFTGAQPVRVFDTVHYNATTAFPDWSHLETKDWMLVDEGIAGRSVCPEALTDFMRYNTSSWSGLNLKTVRDYSQQFKGKRIAVFVRIPLFNGKPAGMEHCADMDWDPETGRLTLRGKPVAVLSSSQPMLAASMP